MYFFVDFFLPACLPFPFSLSHMEKNHMYTNINILRLHSLKTVFWNNNLTCEHLHLPTHTLTRVDTRSSLHKLTLTTIFMSPYFLSEFALTNLHSVTQVAIQPHVALPSLPHFLSADTSTIKLGANAGREQRTFTPESCTGRGKEGSARAQTSFARDPLTCRSIPW